MQGKDRSFIWEASLTAYGRTGLFNDSALIDSDQSEASAREHVALLLLGGFRSAR